MTTQKTWTEMSEAEREAFKQTDAYLDPTNPARVPWGEWSEVAKKELVWAAHLERDIQFFSRTSGEWGRDGAIWFEQTPYRIPPEPKRETVRLMGYGSERLWVFGSHVKDDTHVINIPTEDGKPVTEKCPHCGTAPIDMEELG